MKTKELNKKQEDVLIGLLLCDCSLERSSDTSNARLHIQFTEKTPVFFQNCVNLFQDWITEPTKQVLRAFRDGPAFVQNRARSVYHEVFTKVYPNFYAKVDGKNIRVTPAVSYLNKKLSWEGLAYCLMGDGSRKGKTNRGYEIHVQGQGLEGAIRLAISLYEVFGIQSWPAYDNHKKRNLNYWNLYISADSYDLWGPQVIETFKHCEMYEAKMPHVDLHPYKLKRNLKFEQFYAEFKDNVAVREDTTYKVPDDIVEKYRELQKKRKIRVK